MEHQPDLPCRNKALAWVTQYGRAYWFTVTDTRDGEEWAAIRRGDGTALVAETPGDLLAKVRSDYAGQGGRHG